MIPVNPTPWESNLWQQSLKEAYRSSHALLQALGTQHPASIEPADFPILVPKSFAARIQPGQPQDPLLRQVLALAAEEESRPGFVADPLLETALDAPLETSTHPTTAAEADKVVPGLLQKYQGRVLLITTGGCAINCRYCFRRHFPYQAHRDRDLRTALDAIAGDNSIEEVILSGGDPLILSDPALAQLINRLARIPHVRRVRIHTRLPVVLPQRITAELVTLLTATPLDVVVVVHANHPQELNADTLRAFTCLKSTGAWLFNQAVLLNTVNADPLIQIALAKGLFAQGVIPYYLHLPDPVAGTHHFYVDSPQALAIYAEMQARLPGYLLPKLVREVPKKASKMIVSSP